MRWNFWQRRRCAGGKKAKLRYRAPHIDFLEDRTLLSGVITGLVFQDFNSNGIFDTTRTVANDSGNGTISLAIDRGIGNVAITAYDSAGTVRGSTTSAANGTYTLNATGTGPYRIQFTNLPTGFFSGPRGSDSGTTVQFVPDGNSSNVSLGLVRPADYSQDAPVLVTERYVLGSRTGPNANAAVIVSFNYSAGAGATDGVLSDYTQATGGAALAVTQSQVGTTWGLAYHRFTQTVYAAAYMKLLSGFGPDGTGAIYQMGTTGTTASLFADLNAIFGAGTAGADPHQFDASGNPIGNDNGDIGWDAVGKISLGGLDIAGDGSRVYVMNLTDRSLYALPTSGPLNSTTVYRMPLPAPIPAMNVTGITVSNPLGDLRPFAVQAYQGKLYVGAVNSAEATQNRNDLHAYVYEVTDTGSSLTFNPTPVLQFDLNFTRGQANPGQSGNWLAWSPTRASLPGNQIYPQPMLSGLAFDASGNMILGFRDRDGDQSGTGGAPGRGITSGDTLRAAGSPTGGWVLENNATAGGTTTAGAGNNEGPGGGRYYFQQRYDFTGSTHHNTAVGGVLQLPGYPHVVTSSFDSAYGVLAGGAFNSGGISWFNDSTGTNAKDYQLYRNNGPNFSKANGIGDLIALVNNPPIEIGNRVWRDTNGDGIQEAGEPSLAGVTVHLYAPDGTTVLATAVTDANGEYYFSSAAGTNTTSHIFSVSGLTANTTGYTIRLDNMADYATGGPLAGLLLARPNAGADVSINSKGVLVGGFARVTVNTGTPGANDHTQDFGFLPPASLAGFVYADTNNNGLFEAGLGEVGLAGSVVTLTGTDDLGNAVNMSFTTTAGGAYSFTNLRPSDATGYTLTQTIEPPSTLDGRVTVGTPGGLAGNDAIASIVLNAGVDGTNNNFGELPPASIAGIVYLDSNNNGLFEPGTGETGLAGSTITLTGTDDRGNAVNLTFTTAASGAYSFTNLRPSNAAGYTLTQTVEPPNTLDGRVTVGSPGGTAATDRISGIVLNTGDTGANNNFGELPPGSIAGFVYLDLNNNGLFEPRLGETGLAGSTVTLTGTDDRGNAVNLSFTTSASGAYNFTNLRPSNAAGYTVTQTVEPPNTIDGTVTVGTPGGTAGADRISGIVLTVGVNGAANNFGELPGASVTGFVYVDANNDGVRDLTEAPIPNTAVTLTGVDDRGNPVSRTSTTAANGAYNFSNLRPSNAAGYTVQETQPAGFLSGRNAVGTVNSTPDGTLASPFTDQITTIVLALGNNGVDYNFGEVQPASVSGLVYIDDNNNGVRDVNEAPIPGTTVTLTGTDDLGNPVTLSLATATDGSYHFTNLRPGTYTIRETQPPGFLPGRNAVGTVNGTPDGILATPTIDTITAVILASANDSIDNDFGELQPASLSGFVYEDVNIDGMHQAGEPAIAGVTITLTGSDDLANPVNRTTTTDVNGNFAFNNLRPGTYTLTETQPAGFLQGMNRVGSVGGTLSATDTVTNIALSPGSAGINYIYAEIVPPTLSGKVFLDGNRNGVNDPGDGGVGGVTITLRDGNGNLVATTTTASDGSYSFANLPVGDYTLIESPPTGYGTSTPIMLSVTLPLAGLTNQNFGLTTSSLSGFVYVDPNNNGIQDPGEPGIGGVMVTLTGTDVNGNAVTQTTTTGPDGSYSFSGLLAGTYSLAETDPGGFAPGKATLGAPVGTSGVGRLSGIVLGAGDAGFVNNNFGELLGSAGGIDRALISAPVSAALVFPNFVSKVELLGSTDFTGQVSFVNSLYQNLLGRAPDMAGLDLWSGELFAGVSHRQVATAFWQSAEHRGREVDQFYQTFLHRSADAGGRAGWVNALLAGTSEFDVARMFLTSAEYQAAHGSDSAFIMGLYMDVLGRSAGATEVAGWLQVLQGGLSRDAVAQAFLTS